MNSLFIIALFIFCNSAILPPDKVPYLCFCILVLLIPFVSPKKPDSLSILTYLSLIICFLLSLVFSSNFAYLNPGLSVKYLVMQSGLLIGSIYRSSKSSLSLSFTRHFKRLLYIFIIALLSLPVIAISVVVFAGKLSLFDAFTINQIPGLIGIFLAGPDSAQFSYQSESLQVYPRLILSKSSVSFLILAFSSLFFAYSPSKKTVLIFLIFFLPLTSGFRIAFASILSVCIAYLLLTEKVTRPFLRSSYYYPKSFYKLVVRLVIMLPFCMPFVLMFFDRRAIILAYDRFPTFLASLDFVVHKFPFGTGFGVFWEYSLSRQSLLTSVYGENVGITFVGTEALLPELLTSIGIFGSIVIIYMYYRRIDHNMNILWDSYNEIPPCDRALAYLQFGLAATAFGAAVNLMGMIYFVVMGWKLSQPGFKEP